MREGSIGNSWTLEVELSFPLDRICKKEVHFGTLPTNVIVQASY